MDYLARKIVKVCLMIALVAIVVFAVLYVGNAQKIQRKRHMRLINMYNTGTITHDQYKKLEKENSFLKALFEPED
jgi:hypothetical protein